MKDVTEQGCAVAWLAVRLAGGEFPSWLGGGLRSIQISSTLRSLRSSSSPTNRKAVIGASGLPRCSTLAKTGNPKTLHTHFTSSAIVVRRKLLRVGFGPDLPFGGP